MRFRFENVRLAAACVAALLALALSCGEDRGGKDDSANASTGGIDVAAPGGGAGPVGTGGSSSTTTGGSGGIGGSSPSDPFVCSGPGQCVLVDRAKDCCVPRCGEVGIDFYTAIHVNHLADWHAGQVCAGCDIPPCSEEDQEAFVSSSKYFVPVCQDNRCEVFDLVGGPLTTCTTDSECRLRWGAACCEERLSNPVTLVALSDPQGLRELVCPDRFTQCGPAPSAPIDATAVCGGNDYCEVLFEGTGGRSPSDAGSGRDAALVVDAARTPEAGPSDDARPDSDGG